MSRVEYGFQVATESLPRLCQGDKCYADPQPGRLYCADCQQKGKNHMELKPRAPRPEKSLPHVYFIQAVNGGPIKIGVTGDIDRRLAALQTSNPYKLRVLAAFQCIAEIEKELHLAFHDIRLEGEWFEPRADLVRFIERSISGEIKWGRCGPVAPKPLDTPEGSV